MLYEFRPALTVSQAHLMEADIIEHGFAPLNAPRFALPQHKNEQKRIRNELKDEANSEEGPVQSLYSNCPVLPPDLSEREREKNRFVLFTTPPAGGP